MGVCGSPKDGEDRLAPWIRMVVSSEETEEGSFIVEHSHYESLTLNTLEGTFNFLAFTFIRGPFKHENHQL